MQVGAAGIWRTLFPMAVFAGVVGPVRPAWAQDTTRAIEWNSLTPPLDAALAGDLPIDRLVDLLALQPGVSATNDGALSLRGSNTDGAGVYIDGVPASPGNRRLGPALLGGSYYGAVGTGIGVGTNAIEGIFLMVGPSSAEFGNAESGFLSVETANPGNRVTGSVRYGTDQVFGTAHGLGFNRLQARADGPISNRLGFVAAAVLEGETSERLGLEQNQSPIYQAAGIDTTVAVTFNGNTTLVDVLKFAPSSGIRIPTSAATNYQLLGKLTYALGEHSRLAFTALASQDQRRTFDYLDLYNSPQLGASRSWSRVYALSWWSDVGRIRNRPLSLDAHLSYQTDRTIAGPLDPASELDTRNPFAGWIVKPLGFRFNFDNFPVDQTLLNNYRTQIPGTRRSPYDLENTGQYQLVDQYRNNAYGLTGFSESGGPVGLLTLMKEDRWVGKAGADWQLDTRQRLRLGGEFTHYDITNYSHQLTSSALSDVFIEQPVRMALFAEDRFASGGLTIAAGVRYDRFDTRASRPDGFPRVSSMPGFDPTNPTGLFKPDAAHARLTPHLRTSYAISAQTSIRAGYAEAVQVPDFGLDLSGINTDLQITSGAQAFGTDLGFQRTDQIEVGIGHAFGDQTLVDASVYRKDVKGDVAQVLVSLFDPARGANQDVLQYHNALDERVNGFDLRVTRRVGRTLAASASYSYQDAATVTGIPTDASRPHTVLGILSLATPADWNRGSALGTIFRSLGVYSTFRFASGTPYSMGGVPNGQRLSALKLFDLRVTRTFSVAGGSLVAYVDARNVLNLRTVIRVFSTTGDVRDSVNRLVNRANDIDEYRLEAQSNGVFQVDSSIDLSFGGAADPRTACASWVGASGQAAPPNCVYLIGAEERFGDGDHIFSRAEQVRASDALYDVFNGLQYFTLPGRRVRVGIEVRF